MRTASVLIILASFICLSCATLSPVDGRAGRLVVADSPEKVRPEWQPFAQDRLDGLAYFAGKVSNPRFEFHALRIDVSVPQLRILVAGGGAAIDDDSSGAQFRSTRVSSFVRANDLLAGINALPFSPVSGKEGEPRTNTGIVVTDGVMLSPPHAGFDALVFYTDGSAAIVSQSEILSAENIVHAVGGFQRVMENYELAPRVVNSTVRHPRSAAGISAHGRYVYLLVIDGRRPGSIGATEAEIAILLRALGASEGINFDGGGSTALALRYPDGKVRVVNTPIHKQIPGRERAVAGSFGLKAGE